MGAVSDPRPPGAWLRATRAGAASRAALARLRRRPRCARRNDDVMERASVKRRTARIVDMLFTAIDVAGKKRLARNAIPGAAACTEFFRLWTMKMNPSFMIQA